jgi:protoheme IX farnesyltransferase
VTARTAAFPALVRDVISLAKPRVTALVLCTTAGGLYLAPDAVATPLVLLTLLATAMTVGAANTLNCYLERDVDGLMERTRNRPLPAGRLDPRLALAVGLALAVVSVPLLTIFVNPLTGLLGAVALVTYVLVYTPLKLRSPIALLVGAVPGAIPPLMGWTAVTGSLDLPGLALFAVLFLWQVPHFLAIALYRKEDYLIAGLRTLPVVRGDRAARVHLALWALALVPTTLSLVPLGVAGRLYLIAASLLGAAFIGACLWGLRRDPGRAWARRVFLASIAYLALLFAALMIDAT